MFKLGFSSLACPHYTVDQFIELAAANGFDGVELRFVRGQVDLTALPEFSDSQLAATRRRFEDAGLEVPIVDTSVRLNKLDDATRNAQFAAARANAKIAAEHAAKSIRDNGGPIPPDQDRAETLDAIAAGLRQVAEEVADFGVTAVIESHDDFSTSASLLDLFERGAGDALMVLWDTLHTFRHGERPAETWALLGDRVRHVHMKDSYHADATGFDFAPTGEGIIPLDEIIAVLKDNGYSEYVNFEWEKAWHPEIEDGAVTVPQFARYMASRRQP
jgi:sugar phosphate isomerase/epimerase